MSIIVMSVFIIFWFQCNFFYRYNLTLIITLWSKLVYYCIVIIPIQYMGKITFRKQRYLPKFTQSKKAKQEVIPRLLPWKYRWWLKHTLLGLSPRVNVGNLLSIWFPHLLTLSWREDRVFDSEEQNVSD